MNLLKPIISVCGTQTVIKSAKMKAKKKKRQDDFQKVKLRVGKKKPKADNVTNTTFRTRGINLPEQLRRDSTGPTTQRQLGVNVGVEKQTLN